MDISPRELRDTDIKEGFRGYHRDDVDELLERAASTIEGLSQRMQQLTDRVAQVESSAEGASTRNRDVEETLQRTLILAQRTADEAIADAQQRARQLLEESETKARTLVTEAEASARRMVDDEKRRLEADVRDLGGRRDQLEADVDALEKFESEYRDRLRSSLQADLDALGQGSFEPVTRPSLHDVAIPPAPLPREPEPAPAPAPAARPEPAPAARPEPAPEPDARSRDPFSQLAAVPPPDPEREDDAPPVERVRSDGPPAEGLAAYVSDEPIEAEVLDDDAFFASLREAVRDDAPLGPREEPTSEEFYDQEEGEESGRRRFRRRR